VKIAILHQAVPEDAPPDERDVLDEVAAVRAALDAEVLAIPVGLDLGALRPRLAGVDLVFNLIESLGGSGRLSHLVPSALDAWGVPYTGARAEMLLLAQHKPLAKRWLEAAGIRTPPAEHDGPCIVKPIWEDASVGIDGGSVVSAAEARRIVAERGEGWFAEAFIAGRELNVGLLDGPGGPEVLRIAEIRFVGEWGARPKIVGYSAKWDESSFEYRSTVRCFDFAPPDDELLAEAARIARASWDAFGLSGHARVDLRVAEDGRIYVLEVNANPCLSPDAGFAAALQASGIGFREAMARVVESGRRRCSRVERPLP